MKSPQYIHYTDPLFCAEFLADMERPSIISGAKNGMLTVEYDVECYNFRPLVVECLLQQEIIGKEYSADATLMTLEGLHRFVSLENQMLDNTQHNRAAVALYETGREFNNLYLKFISEVIAPALGLGALHRQQTPTFRVFFPHSVGYPGKTTYHSDIMLGHNPREINVFLPFTSCEASRSLLIAPLEQSMEIMSACGYNFGEFAKAAQSDAMFQKTCENLCMPLEMEVGEVLIFDSRCLHAGPPNLTDKSRLTMDFRLLAQQDIENQQNRYRGTGRTKSLFAPGGAFSSGVVSPTC